MKVKLEVFMATIDKTRLSEGMRADLADYEKTKEDTEEKGE